MIRNEILKIFGISIVITLLTSLCTYKILMPSRLTYDFKSAITEERYNGQSASNVTVFELPNDEMKQSTISATPLSRETRLNNVRERVTPSLCSLQWNTIGRTNTALQEANNSATNLSRLHLGSDKSALLLREPDFRLDSNKYLLAVFKGGPNNQLIGFFETIFIAIRLNRTLVLPNFKKHRTDSNFRKGSQNLISPLHRVDVVSLCNFVSCITFEQFRNDCNFCIDGVLNTRYLAEANIHAIESMTKMSMPSKEGENMSFVNDILVPRNRTSNDRRYLPFMANEIEDLFSTKARCVVYPFPFGDVRVSDSSGNVRTLLNRLDSKSQDMENFSDIQLISKVVQRSRRPPYVRKIALEFINNMTRGEQFLCVHWRYSHADYSNSSCSTSKEKIMKCNKIKNYSSEQLAKRIKDKATKLMKKKFAINRAYIAVPRLGIKFIADTAKQMANMTSHKFKIFHGVDLENFIKENYRNCHFLTEHFEDILSTIEMEICSRSVAFLGSVSSTWSGNVFKSRTHLDKKFFETSREYIYRI